MSSATFSPAPKFNGSNRSIYIWLQTLVKERWKTRARNYIKHVNIPKIIFCRPGCFNFCFSFLAATNTDLLCILLFSTDCSFSAIKKPCITQPQSKTTLLKLSTLKEQVKVLEFLCYLRK